MRKFTLMVLLGLAVMAWAGATWQCTILHTNDLHGMLLPFDYLGMGGATKDAGGLARRATLVNRLRAQITDRPVLLIDTGDTFTRGPWHTRFYGEPEIEAMNLLNYDMLVVGNNEFKATEGVDSQGRMLALLHRSRFPWLAANLTVGDTGVAVPGVLPFIVRRYGDVRVGFLGLTAPRSAGYAQTKGWTISDPIAVAKTHVPDVRKECDILIAVTHIGVDLDKELAASVPGIDVIVGGDSHTFLPEPLWVKNPVGVAVPIVQAGEQGVRLGRLDLTFIQDGAWKPQKAEGQLLPIDNTIPDDPAMKALLDRFLAPLKTGLLPAWQWAA